MLRQRLTSFLASGLVLGALCGSSFASVQIVGADPAACESASSICTQHLTSYSFVSLTEGNVAETYSAAQVTSAFGPTLTFDLIYNSYNADGTRASTDTGIGYGWTHTYNDYLFTQGEDIFRWRGNGRVTKYSLVNGSYQATPGYFETLVMNGQTSITITDKYQTQYYYLPIFRPQQDPLVPGRDGSGDLFRLVSITDRNGNVTTLTYSYLGYVISITDTYKRSLTLAYDGNLNLSSVTDPMGRTTTFGYDPKGALLTTIKDPAGHVTTYTYNSLNQVTSKTDRDGRLFTIGYQNNLPFSEMDANAGLVYSLSNPLNWATDPNQLEQNYLRVYIPSTTSRTDGRGNVWNYQYDSNGFPLAISAPDGATTSYSYDPNTLRPTSITDANGHTTTFQYDSEGNLVQRTDANGNTSHLTYDSKFNQVTSATDPNGRVSSYAYDGSGNRVSATDPLQGTATWTYDSHGNILSETDKNGNITTYTYDTDGNRSSRTDALHGVTTFKFDTVGNLISVTDANSHTTTNKYDSLNRLTSVTDALGDTKQYSYDGEGDKTTYTDENGNATNYLYDQRRRLVKTIDAVNNSSTESYDANNNRISETDFNGHTTMYTFDVQNRLVSTKDALGHVSSSGYDLVGNKTSVTDANGHTTEIAFDNLDRKVQSTDALGEVTTWSYDLTGLPGCPQCTGPTFGSNLITKQADGNGKVIYWAYDGLDRLIINVHKQGATDYVIGPDDAVNRNTYDANSNHTSVTDPLGNTTTYTYNALNLLIKEVNPAGEATTTAYDPVGNPVSITYPTKNVVTNTYDAANRPLQQSDSSGKIGALTFDPAGNITAVTDGNNQAYQFVYDKLNRVVLSIVPTTCPVATGCPSTFTYDAQGNQISSTDNNGNVETYRYDEMNRLTSVTNSVGNVSKSDYDAVGNVTDLTDANGHVTSAVYDAVNRPISETYADPADNTITWTYDKVGHVTSRTDQKSQVTTYTYTDLYFMSTRSYVPSGITDLFTYDLAGRALSETHAAWVNTFIYDGVGRVVQTTQNGRVISYVYDIPERKRTITYPGGRTITEQMDPRMRLSTVNDGGTTPIAQYTYDPADNPLTRAFRNGTLATYTYSQNNRVLSLNHTLGNQRLLGFQYTYDAEGNPLSQNKLNDPGNSETFGRNKVYQLIDHKIGMLVSGTIPDPTTRTTYTLDPVGNWQQTITTSQGGTHTETRTHSASNEITSINGVAVESDSNGNLTDDGSKLYSYDEENRLIKAVDKATNHVLGEYQYDAAGRRVSKIDDFGVQTFYYYDGMRSIEEQSSLGETEATYVFGKYLDEVVTMDRGGQTFYYHQNAVYSVYAISNSAGAVVEAYDYDAYGAQTIVLPGQDGIIHYDERDMRLTGAKSAYGNPFFFTGQRYDPETGLMYYKQRYYSPALGRFMTRDPIGIWTDPINLGNGYTYVGDNPASWTDPYGTWSLKKFLKKVGSSISNAVQSVTKAVAKVASKVIKAATNAANAIAQSAANVANAIAQGFNNVVTAVKNANYAQFFQNLATVAGGLVDIQTFLMAFEDLKKFHIGDFIKNALDSLGAKLIFGAASCVSFASDVVDTVSHGLQPNKTALGVLGAIGVNTKDTFSLVVGDAATVLNAVNDGYGCWEFIATVAAL